MPYEYYAFQDNNAMASGSLHDHEQNQRRQRRFVALDDSQKSTHGVDARSAYDLFISYANVDDAPVFGAKWVSTLVQDLRNLLAQKMGRNDAFSIWWDETDLRSNHEITRKSAPHYSSLPPCSWCCRLAIWRLNGACRKRISSSRCWEVNPRAGSLW